MDLKKHVPNVARINHGFVELIVILFTLDARCDYVIPYQLFYLDFHSLEFFLY